MLALATLLSSGCHEDSVEVETAEVFVQTYQACPRPKVDVLLVIDDSPSMAPFAGTIGDSLATIGTIFDENQDGEDIRLAITTTSVPGPTCDRPDVRGGEPVIDSCLTHLDDFVGPTEIDDAIVDTREACSQWCPLESIALRPSPTDETPDRRSVLAVRPWFDTISNPYHGNLDGVTLSEVLPCVGLRGHVGCEFESPMAAALRALERSDDPLDPMFGFLREDAGLLVVFIGDEDDCSHPDASATIFDPAGERVFWTDPAADQANSAVCFHAGMTCDGERCAVLDRGLDGVATSEPDAAALLSVGDFEAALANIVGERDTFVSIVGGLSNVGNLHWSDPTHYPEQAAEYGWGPGCTSPHVSAQPPARLLAAADGVSGYPSGFSLCDSQLVDAVAMFHSHSEASFVAHCLPEQAGSRNEWFEPYDPACELHLRRPDGERELAARGATPHAASLGLFAQGFVAETGSTPGTAAFRLRALDENPGAGRRDGLHHGLLVPECEAVIDPDAPNDPDIVPPAGASNCVLWGTDDGTRTSSQADDADWSCRDLPWAHDSLGWTHASFRVLDGSLRHEPHGTTYELECEPFVAP